MLEKKQTKKIEEILTAIDLEQPAPSEEPMRQYYFMEKARRLVKAQSETVGRPLTFHVTTFGCQMNARDSEKLTGILEQIGYVEEEEENQADFVIYYTCTVRENANQKVYGHFGTAQPCEKEKSAYADRTLRMYDAGAGSSREVKEKLSVCGSDLRNAQYF